MAGKKKDPLTTAQVYDEVNKLLPASKLEGDVDLPKLLPNIERAGRVIRDHLRAGGVIVGRPAK